MNRRAEAQTELHRHLDVSIRLSTLLELAQARGLESQSTSLAAFRRKIVLETPAPSLNDMLGRLTLFQQIMDRPEVLARIGREAIADCHVEGTAQVEFRFSPGWVSEKSGLGWDDVLIGFEAGIAEGLKTHPDMRAGLICIATREQGMETVARTVEFFLRNRSRLIGIDLAGNEIDFPNRAYEKLFKPLRGEAITIHAGEAGGPENIWEAIDLLGARRIGHGIAAIRDPELLERLRRDGICLEVCPVSNWLTTSVKSLAAHPLPQLLRAGIPVSLNTDDPTVFGTDLKREIEVCRREMSMSDAEIAACFAHAAAASFIR